MSLYKNDAESTGWFCRKGFASLLPFHAVAPGVVDDKDIDLSAGTSQIAKRLKSVRII
jgi:hypothetical protein